MTKFFTFRVRQQYLGVNKYVPAELFLLYTIVILYTLHAPVRQPFYLVTIFRARLSKLHAFPPIPLTREFLKAPHSVRPWIDPTPPINTCTVTPWAPFSSTVTRAINICKWRIQKFVLLFSFVIYLVLSTLAGLHWPLIGSSLLHGHASFASPPTFIFANFLHSAIAQSLQCQLSAITTV